MPELLVAASGAWGRVIWARAADGIPPAKTFFEALSTPDQAKTLVLFRRMAEIGPSGLQNREKFKFLDEVRGERIFEFKSFQLRFLGGFRPGGVFLVAHALRKKSDDLPPSALEIAARGLREHDAFHSSQRKGRP